MPCVKVPVPPLPPLPPGISLTPFVPPVLPSVGLCCKIPLPAYPIPTPVIAVAFPAAVVTTYNAYAKAMRTWFDSLQVDCPLN